MPLPGHQGRASNLLEGATFALWVGLHRAQLYTLGILLLSLLVPVLVFVVVGGGRGGGVVVVVDSCTHLKPHHKQTTVYTFLHVCLISPYMLCGCCHWPGLRTSVR